MKRILFAFLLPLLCSSQLLGDTDSAQYPGLPDNAYLSGGDSTIAVILLHGRGKHPRWLVVNPLRKAINNRQGWHTLSLQMPNDDVDFSQYKHFFPDAYTRIQAGIDFLRKEKGVTSIYIIGHSMGSRMGSAFIALHPDITVNGFVGIGMRNSGSSPLNPLPHLKIIKQQGIPVLDLYGNGNGKDVAAGKGRRKLVSDLYTQVEIPNADHKFKEHKDELNNEVISWLKAIQQ